VRVTPPNKRILDRHAILLGYIAAVVTILLIFQLVGR
jgi:hypothetical protein